MKNRSNGRYARHRARAARFRDSDWRKCEVGRDRRRLHNPDGGKRCNENNRVGLAQMKTVELVTAQDHFHPFRFRRDLLPKIFRNLGTDVPASGWRDLAAAFTGAWLSALLRLGRGEVAQDTVHFYYGAEPNDFTFTLLSPSSTSRVSAQLWPICAPRM